MTDEGLRCRTQLRKFYSNRRTEHYESASKFGETMRNYLHEYRKWEYACQTMQSNHYAQFSNSLQAPLQVTMPQPGSLLDGFFSRGRSISNGAGVTFQTAPLLRRLVAEGIDFTICLVLKILFVLFLIEMEWIDIVPYQKVIEEDHDIVEFIVLTQSLLPLELFCKFICAILEGIITVVNVGPCRKGQTPGKYIVGIRVITADVFTTSPIRNHIQVHGAREITFAQSIVRSILKNIVVNSFFPLSTFAFNFPTPRSFYDTILKTAVVIG